MNILANQVSPHEGCSYIIFGASGDLAKKKLFPSLYQLYKEKMLPKKFFVVGYSRTVMTKADYIIQLEKHFKYQDKAFFKCIDYVHGAYEPCDEMASLEKIIAKHSLNRIFYFSLPPGKVRDVCRSLRKLNLITENSGSQEYAHTIIGQQPFTRLVLEKPFGTNLVTAIKLERFLDQHFTKSQLFVIDHYLGKEPIQNILFFRFANTIFENIWNSNFIEHIQVSLLEEISVDKRAGYFDETGILRDMVQSHGLQMLALIAMEPPGSFEAKYIRTEKSKVLQALRPYNTKNARNHTIRGQYENYLKEDGVAQNSKTETLVGLKTYIDNWRWFGVPIYIRAGKSLEKKSTEIIVTFKKVPYNIFGEEQKLAQNKIVFRFQPDTFIKLRVTSKVPGNETIVKTTDLDFPYAKEFEGLSFSNGYDRIIYSSLANDATLFLSTEEIFAQWKFIDSIHQAWAKGKNIPVHTYKKNTSGPKALHKLLSEDDKEWNT